MKEKVVNNWINEEVKLKEETDVRPLSAQPILEQTPTPEKAKQNQQA